MTATNKYHVEAVSERTNARVRLSHGEPMTQDEAIRFRDRFTPHPMRRLQLCPAGPVTNLGLEAAGDVPASAPRGACASPAWPVGPERTHLPCSR